MPTETPPAAPPTAPKPKNALPKWVIDNPEVAVGSITSGKPQPPAEPPPSDPPVTPALAPPAEPPKTPVAAAAPTADEDEAFDSQEFRPATPVKVQFKEMKENARKRREALKQQLADRDTKLAEATAQLEKAKATPPLAPTEPPDSQALRDENARLKVQYEAAEKRLKMVDLANEPRFKEYYDGAISRSVATIKTMVGSEVGDRLASLVTQPDSVARQEQIDAAMADLSPARQAQVGALIVKITELSSERQAELAKAPEYLAQMDNERAVRVKADRDAAEKLVSGTVAAMRGADDLKPFLGVAEADVIKRIALGGTKDPADTVKLIGRGLVFPKVLQALSERDKKITELEGQIAKLHAAEPGAGRTTLPPTGEKPKSTKTGSERMIEAFQQKGFR